MGIDLSLYKSLTFGVSALYTGVAGALGAIAIAFVAPDSFTFVLSIALFVGLVVGGVGLDPGRAVRWAVRAVRAEHRRAGLQGPGRRDLRAHPAAGHLSDAVRRCGPGSPMVHRLIPAARDSRLNTAETQGGRIMRTVNTCADRGRSRLGCAVGGVAGRRAEEIRSRRERHRDQDRQHQALQRAGVGLRHDRQDASLPTSRRSTPRAASTAARSTSSPTTTATARRRRSSRRASWSRATRCC